MSQPRGVYERIEALEEWSVQRDRDIAELAVQLSREAATFASLKATVDAIREKVLPQAAPAARRPGGRAALAASAPPRAAPQAVFPAQALASARPAAPPPAVDSLIVADFPALFPEFRGRRFALLLRGSRDGFGARDFHGRCDGHAPTLALIRDTRGNIFGGFTPVEWESREPRRAVSARLKGDPSLASFLFTVKNPHGFHASKFALRPEKQGRAIDCDSRCGPNFCDLCVRDLSNANNENFAFFDGKTDSYNNDTGMDGETFFTGARYFTVEEIEVFKITN
jgi:hypothetical protein